MKIKTLKHYITMFERRFDSGKESPFFIFHINMTLLIFNSDFSQSPTLLVSQSLCHHSNKLVRNFKNQFPQKFPLVGRVIIDA